jgi:leader peptidase (prepilin peptidase)/N-methyltransferase
MGARMILIPSPQSFARWRAVVSRTAAMWPLETIAVAAAGACAVAVSVALLPDWRGFAGAGLAVVMFAIAAVDMRRFIIPNELTAVALALGLVHAAIEEIDPWAEALGWHAVGWHALGWEGLGWQDSGWQAVGLQSVGWSALRGAALALAFLGLRALYRRLRGREGIGLGDVKLAGVAGVWLDWSIIPVAIEIAALAALGTFLVRHLCFRRAMRPTTRLPFGLFLAPAIWIGWLLEATLLYPPLFLSSWSDVMHPVICVSRPDAGGRAGFESRKDFADMLAFAWGRVARREGETEIAGHQLIVAQTDR